MAMYDLKKYSVLTADSRQVQPGAMFVAVRGVTVDGHSFIGTAVEAGAKAVVCEEVPEGMLEKHPEIDWIVVKDSALELGAIADEWYGHPSSRLTLVGVTGTNGKTTCATLLYELATLAGHKAGLISTVVNKVAGKEYAATHTTPDVITLHRLMAEMVEAGCDFCAMEVSSHACHQKRIAGLKFAGGIFTNLTRDHLDYHKTFANYLAAKKSFFDGLGPDAWALSNADDKNGEVMLQGTHAHKYTYSIRGAADFRGHVMEDVLGGMVMTFSDRPNIEVHTAFTGRFNASNLTAVHSAWLLLGNDPDEALRLVSLLVPVAGRMQTLRSRRGVTAVVDYAHTPDALVNTLDAIAEVTRGGRIITVVGAGGDRDKGKRPMMAKQALIRSDKMVITSDNPRSEDPAEICREMLEGVSPERMADVEVVLDRAQAISHALRMAAPGDAVLIAGKGHEDYQILGTKKIHFSDIEEVEKTFSSYDI